MHIIDKNLVYKNEEVSFSELIGSDDSEKYYFVHLMSIIIRKMVKKELKKIDKNSEFLDFKKVENCLSGDSECDEEMVYSHFMAILDSIDE